MTIQQIALSFITLVRWVIFPRFNYQHQHQRWFLNHLAGWFVFIYRQLRNKIGLFDCEQSIFYLYSSETDEPKNNEIPLDPWCDDDHPKIVPFEKISAAAYRITGGVVKTPCDVSRQIQKLIEKYMRMCLILS